MTTAAMGCTGSGNRMREPQEWHCRLDDRLVHLGKVGRCPTQRLGVGNGGLVQHRQGVDFGPSSRTWLSSWTWAKTRSKAARILAS